MISHILNHDSIWDGYPHSSSEVVEKSWSPGTTRCLQIFLWFPHCPIEHHYRCLNPRRLSPFHHFAG